MIDHNKCGAMSATAISRISVYQGAVVANYPWDGSDDRKTKYVASPDDATFKHLASVYAKAHKDMALPSNRVRPEGLVFGTDATETVLQTGQSSGC